MEPRHHSLAHTANSRLAEILLVASVPLLVIWPGWALVADDDLSRQLVVWVANFLMILAIWLFLRLRGQTLTHFGVALGFNGWWAIFSLLWRALLVLIVALGAFMLAAIPMLNLGFDIQKADMSSYGWLHGNPGMLMLALVGVWIVSSFGEELIYRGFLINRIAEIGDNSRKAVIAAVVISSLVFGLIHFSWGLTGVVQTTVMGFVLALAYLKLGRKLWPLIIAHGVMDTLLIVQLYLAPPPA